MLRRHEILRTTFDVLDDQPVQIVAPLPTEGLVTVIDLRDMTHAAREAELARLIHEEPFRPFDLRRDRAHRVLVASIERLTVDCNDYIAFFEFVHRRPGTRPPSARDEPCLRTRGLISGSFPPCRSWAAC